jgi:hypothetical protein
LKGAFEPVTGGFQVVGAAQTVQIGGVTPAVPKGTFVRLTFDCIMGFSGDAGGFIQIDNVASFGGQPNPMEDGARLWFYEAAGGSAPFPTTLPFTIAYEDVCTVGDVDSGIKRPNRLVISGEGFMTKVDPGTESVFAVPSGAAQGSYRARNVNVTFISFPGGDATSNDNFTIAREL